MAYSFAMSNRQFLIVNGELKLARDQEATHLEIPNGVVSISTHAFGSCTNLKKLTVPGTVTKFEGFFSEPPESLEEVILSYGVKEIRRYAFSGCKKLRRVEIPSAVECIGESAFSSCESLEEVKLPNGLKEIGDDTFWGCKKLRWVEIPPMVENIGEGAFWSCESLEEVKLPNGLKEIGKKAFYDCKSLKAVKLPEGLTEIGEEAFYGCQSLEEVKLPEGLKEIGEEAFYSCESLTRLTLPGDVKIKGEKVFGWAILGLDPLKQVELIGDKRLCSESIRKLQWQFPNASFHWSAGKKAYSAAKEKTGANTAETQNSASATDVADGDQPLNNQVRVTGHWLEVGDRWRMELPYGVRARNEALNGEPAHRKLGFYIDRQEFGACMLGNTVTSQISLTNLSEVIFNKSIVEGSTSKRNLRCQTRNDEKLRVQLELYVTAEGKSAFRITIEEKQLQNLETLILLIPSCEVDDVHETFDKLKTRDVGTQPFGAQWDQYWKTAMRMAASIAPVHEQKEKIELSTNPIQEGEISLRLPKVLKPFTMDNGVTIYLPTRTGPTRNDLDRLEAYPYYMGLRRFHMPPMEHYDTWVLSCATVNSDNPFAQPICEKQNDKFYKGLYLCFNGEDYIPLINISMPNGISLIFVVISDSGYCPAKLRHIAEAIFDTIQCNGADEDAVPEPLPLKAPEFCYKHYDLIISGAYTTRRRADFIGQSIRALMEENDETDAEAYDQMLIPDDAYTLDQQALELAKAFHGCKADSPWAKTEEMIGQKMFADVSMFHALRSLGWTLCCMADRERKPLEKFSYARLQEVGRAIEKCAFQNYTTESYCSGLCSHDDWHVFYVTDAYLGSDCEKNTDLRILCGKDTRSGNTMSFYFGGANSGRFESLNKVNDLIREKANDLIRENEETLESLEALRQDLQELLPAMRTISEGLKRNQASWAQSRDPLAQALAAWCALAVAAKEPFYSEEAQESMAEAWLKSAAVREKEMQKEEGSRQICRRCATLQERIETARQIAQSDPSVAPGTFDQVLEHLDREATVTIEGKHFVVSGFGQEEEQVCNVIREHGGVVHSSMVKSADYLVICLDHPGIAKLKKALEWRTKHAKNLIVSDYQFWKAVSEEKEASAEETPVSSVAEQPRRFEPARETTAGRPQPSKPVQEKKPEINPEKQRIEKEIEALKEQMNSLKGLFRGFKRKKLQKQINELQGKLIRL